MSHAFGCERPVSVVFLIRFVAWLLPDSRLGLSVFCVPCWQQPKAVCMQPVCWSFVQWLGVGRCACADRLAGGDDALRSSDNEIEGACVPGRVARLCWFAEWHLPVPHQSIVSSSGQARCWVGASLLGGAGSLCVLLLQSPRESPWCPGCMVYAPHCVCTSSAWAACVYD